MNIAQAAISNPSKTMNTLAKPLIAALTKTTPQILAQPEATPVETLSSVPATPPIATIATPV